MSAIPSGIGNDSMWEQQLCRRFTLPEIVLVTRNFDERLVIGQGGFGKVYKGQLGCTGMSSSTNFAAVKRLDSGSKQGAAEFWAEIEMLSKLRHCHLVSLIGYCNDGDQMILVYEFMPHGTLGDHLHTFGATLSWVQRLKICIGAARGLDYLHTGTGTQHGVIHRDLKSSNILLDEHWEAKISDFGLSKMGPANQPSTYVNTVVKGTFGYVDPEYFLTGRLTRKSDVFAFGVVLFEVLCGRCAVDTSLDDEQWGLARWAQECIEAGRLDQIIDSRISGQISPKCLKEFAHIANRCLHGRPKLRPTMAEVVVSLEVAMMLQESTDNSVPHVGLSAFTRKVQKCFFTSRVANSDDARSWRRSKIHNNALTNKDEEVHNGIDQKEQKDGSVERQGERRQSNTNPRLSNPPKSIHSEHAAAGWPPWLVAVAGEAINGWTPLWDDTFEILDKIGQGSHSLVYKGRDTLTGKLVALKKVRFNKLKPDSVKFMAREILILRHLDHPNVIKLEGLVISRSSSSLFLVFDFMEHDLDGFAANPTIKLTEPQVKCYMHQLLSGLEHCHQRHILHRDIKGSNLLIDNEGVLKIAGFGLASFFDPNHKQPMTCWVVNLWYQSPELLLGATDYGVGVDLWSVGCILAQLLAGKPVMRGRMQVDQLHKIFKLCGYPSEEYFEKLKLPNAIIFKPKHPYRRCIAEKFSNFPPSSLPLIESLLALDPAERQTAAAALRSEFFTTKPFACDRSSLLKYPLFKKGDALQDEEARSKTPDKLNAGCVKKNQRRERAARVNPTPEVTMKLQTNASQKTCTTTFLASCWVKVEGNTLERRVEIGES